MKGKVILAVIMICLYNIIWAVMQWCETIAHVTFSKISWNIHIHMIEATDVGFGNWNALLHRKVTTLYTKLNELWIDKISTVKDNR